jgi:hypothetical protein
LRRRATANNITFGIFGLAFDVVVSHLLSRAFGKLYDTAVRSRYCIGGASMFQITGSRVKAEVGKTVLPRRLGNRLPESIDRCDLLYLQE